MVPKSIYFEKHPEYYSLRDGRRVKEGQLCLSNPDVLRITIKNMRKTMRENPDYLIYPLTQDNNFGYCQCPKCQTIADQYGGQSGIMIWFVNQVADAVREEFPDKYIGTFEQIKRVIEFLAYYSSGRMRTFVTSLRDS